MVAIVLTSALGGGGVALEVFRLEFRHLQARVEARSDDVPARSP